jgi:hypothetical protein
MVQIFGKDVFLTKMSNYGIFKVVCFSKVFRGRGGSPDPSDPLPKYVPASASSLVSILAPGSVIDHELAISSSLSILLDGIDLAGELEASTQSCQHKLSKLVSDITFNGLQDTADKFERARILAASHKDSARWMHAIPCEVLGTKLDNATTRIAVALRLGSRIVVPHICRCSRQVDALGRHGLSCELSAGRQSRHSQINDIFSRALTSAAIPNIREVTGLSTSDNKRPDGMTLIPYASGRPLVRDATVSDIFAASNVRPQLIQPNYPKLTNIRI